MQLVTLDFETYFDKEYSLKKMTTEAYIRDPRFKVHCVGAMEAGKKADSSSKLVYPDMLESCAVLCHHAQFDGLILSHHFGIKPAFWFDTLSMARMALPHLKSHSLAALAEYYGLPQKTVPYDLFIGKRDLDAAVQHELEEGCRHDVELTYEIFKRLLPLVPQEELWVIDMTIRMFTEPKLQLDSPKLGGYLNEIRTKKEAVLSSLGVTEAELASSAKFSTLLEKIGAEVPTKISAKGNQIPALAKTDEGMKGLLEHEDEKVQALAAARLGVKSTINETRTERLLSTSSRGALPIYLKYYGAHTGRWSGGDGVNWQNLPRGGVIRQSVLAPPGYSLVVADLSQIEARILAWLAGEEELLDAFRNGRDVYSEFASKMYGREIVKARDKKERQVAKSAVLGAGYGMGATKFEAYCKASGVYITQQEAEETIQIYRKLNPRIKKYWYRWDGELLDMMVGTRARCIELPNGAKLDYSTLGKDEYNFYLEGKKGKTYIWGGTIVENYVQALARIILSQVMIDISKLIPIVNCIHDEIWCLVPEGEGEKWLEFILNRMRQTPVWAEGLPLDAEGFYGSSYAK